MTTRKATTNAKISASPLVVEMYTRLMTGAVAKSNAAARKKYLATKRKEDALYAEISRGVNEDGRGDLRTRSMRW